MPLTETILNPVVKQDAQNDLTKAYTRVAHKFLDAGQYQDAISVADKIAEITSRWSVNSKKSAGVFAEVAEKYAETKQFDKATQLAATIEDPKYKDWALSGIAGGYAKVGRFADAMRIVDTLQDLESKDRSLTSIAAAHAEGAHYAEAIQVANRIHFPQFRRETFTKITIDSMKAGDLPPTFLPTVNAIGDPSEKSSVLGAIADVLAQAGRLDEGLQIAITIPDASEKSSALGRLAKQFAEAGLLDRSLEAARTIEDPDTKARALADIADNYAKSNEVDKANHVLDEAKQIAERQETNSYYSSLGNVAGVYVQWQRFDEARAIADKLQNPYSRADSLAFIAKGYFKAGKTSKAMEVLSEAIKALSSLTPGKDYTAPRDSAENTLREKASSLAFDKQFALALHVCQSLESMADKVDILGDIGVKYAQSGQKLDSPARKILHDIIAANP